MIVWKQFWKHPSWDTELESVQRVHCCAGVVQFIRQGVYVGQCIWLSLFSYPHPLSIPLSLSWYHSHTQKNLTYLSCSPLIGIHSGTSKGQPHCSDPSRPCNPCLDATKACNLNENCKRQRSNYISTCTRAQTQGQQPSQSQSQDSCNRKRCHKALRQFFERVETQYTYGLLFCSCKDQACAERRRQTIVPSCSYLDKSKPNCLQLRNTCRLDVHCR